LRFINKRTYSKDATLISCGGNGWVRFWDVSNNKLAAEFQSHLQGWFLKKNKKNKPIIIKLFFF